MKNHYIITNRKIINENQGGECIYPDGDEEARDELRYAFYTVNTEDPKEEGKVELIKDENDSKTMKANIVSFLSTNEPVKGSTLVLSELYSKMTERTNINLVENRKNDVLLFIHGFKNDLHTALITMNRLYDKYVKPNDSPIGHLVLFTWPARSNLLKYRDDARDAQKTGYALGRGYKRLVDFFKETFKADPKTGEPINPLCKNKIHFMCHSMGNRVLECMFQQFLSDNVHMSSVFGEVFLMAADIDFDALEKPKPLYNLIRICDRVHVYYNENDKALWTSETTKNAFNRLGKFGPMKIDNLPDYIYANNVSSITDDTDGILSSIFATHHGYFAESDTVVKDVIKVLNGGISDFKENRKK
jgi:esterase/lipase superfamily enzyme